MNESAIERLTTVRSSFADWEVDAIFVGSKANRTWLSGFTGSAAWLLVTEQKALIGTDFRYYEQAKSQAPSFELFPVKGRPSDALPEFIAAGEVSRIGIESKHLTLSQFEMLQVAQGIDWVKLDEAIEQKRQIKSPEEISLIRKAAGITDLVMSQVQQIAHTGMSEAELAWELEKRLRESGGSGMAFPIIVASGLNASRAHHEPGDRKFEHGDPIIVDMGAKYEGYCSDLTRTFFVGDQPDEKFLQIYEIVLKAQVSALENMNAGSTGKQIDSLARNVIVSAGFGEEFGHSLGHGLGLEVHEDPRLSQLAEDQVIEEYAVVTVEPGIYLPEWGGVRIEDLVVMTASGVEILSNCPKEPVIAL